MSFITGGGGGVTLAQLNTALAPIATTAGVTSATSPLATTAQLTTGVRVIKSIQAIDITVVLDGALGTKTATQTVTAVTTAKTFLTYCGFRSSVGINIVPPSIEITNSTTITAKVENANAANGGVEVFGYLVEYL